jgi:hypothetical protein
VGGGRHAPLSQWFESAERRRLRSRRREWVVGLTRFALDSVSNQKERVWGGGRRVSLESFHKFKEKDGIVLHLDSGSNQKERVGVGEGASLSEASSKSRKKMVSFFEIKIKN